MKVQYVQSNPTFEKNKRRFIDYESQEQLVQVLRKMDKETEYKENEYSFAHSKITRLELFSHDKNKKLVAELVDARKNLKKLPEGKDIFGTTSLTIDKVQLVIDNKSGEIIAYHKPMLKTWKNIIKKINYTLIDFNNCFYSAVVKKHKFGIEGLTKKGAEALEKMKIKLK